MELSILSVGKVRQRFILDGEQEYAKRITSGLTIRLVDLGMESPESLTVEQAQEREADAVLKKIDGYCFVVALDERGRELDTSQMRKVIEDRMLAGSKKICFIIGGSFGLSERVRQRADLILSLSRMTLPHQLARLVLVEQIYRVHTMIRGVRYHK